MSSELELVLTGVEYCPYCNDIRWSDGSYEIKIIDCGEIVVYDVNGKNVFEKGDLDDRWYPDDSWYGDLYWDGEKYVLKLYHEVGDVKEYYGGGDVE